MLIFLFLPNLDKATILLHFTIATCSLLILICYSKILLYISCSNTEFYLSTHIIIPNITLYFNKWNNIYLGKVTLESFFEFKMVLNFIGDLTIEHTSNIFKRVFLSQRNNGYRRLS